MSSAPYRCADQIIRMVNLLQHTGIHAIQQYQFISVFGEQTPGTIIATQCLQPVAPVRGKTDRMSAPTVSYGRDHGRAAWQPVCQCNQPDGRTSLDKRPVTRLYDGKCMRHSLDERTLRSDSDGNPVRKRV